MKRKNQLLIGLVAALVLANLWVSNFGNRHQASFDPSLFKMDTSLIQSLEIKGATVDNRLLRLEEGWQLNGQYRVDRYFKRILMSLLSSITVKRKLSGAYMEDLKSESSDQVIAFIIMVGDELRELEVLWNGTMTKTFFFENGEGYEVGIPGYREFIGGIFRLTENQWRDRTLYSSTSYTLQEVTVSTNSVDFKINFDGQHFPEMEGNGKADSTSLLNYLSQFEKLQVNERLSVGQFAVFDSLSKTKPFARISIRDITMKEPLEVQFFPKMDGQHYHLLATSKGDLAVLDEKVVQSLLKPPS